MDSEVLILGGGFAGLSCGVALAQAGRRVTVLEKKPRLGGRAFSFKDTESGDVVDNGQHLFMGCYRHTRRFLAAIGAQSRLSFAGDIRVDFADSEGNRDALVCPASLGAPLHLAAGVMGLRGLSLPDKWGLLRLDRALRGYLKTGVPARLDRLTVRQWLDELGQSRRIQERLFDPIALGALNDDPSVAAATGFAQVLQEAFYRDVDSTRLGLSTVGLSDLYTEAAKTFIEERGGAVAGSAKAVEILEREGKARGVRFEDATTRHATHIVSTLAPWDLKKVILPAALRGPWEELDASPIVSVSLWYDRPVISEPFVGMLGTEIQWVFNKSRILSLKGEGQYLALVVSGAHKHIAADPKALLLLAQRDLLRCFPAVQKAKMVRWKVVKEPFATLSPVPGSDERRVDVHSALPGFLFAGDWTRTGLPATIESAVLSGHRAAEHILKRG